MKDEELSALARLARATISRELGVDDVRDEEMDAAFTCLGASFVPLRWNDGRLQGCIGSLEPRRALADDVAQNALAACFADPRATPISAGDLDALKVEVSVLSPLERIAYDGTEAGARAALRVGTDGVLLTCCGHRGTFLPQMWEQLETPEEFLTELKRKAHLSPEFWSPEIELQRYTVAKGVS
ncbi:MAG TPA: AmmeMemoRadiSam system protein A [Polyangiaceae bacterium]